MKSCPQCNATLAEDAPEGLCPRCLAAAAFATQPTIAGATGGGVAPGERLHYFGEYELIEEIGAGGMGVVWLARQIKLNRTVALKMVRSGLLASPDEVRRFLVEAEAAARLQHAGIVSIHEIGEYEGQHFFTMDFVEGRSLAALLREKPLEPRRATELLRAVAEAVAYAHGRGILHRDIKPGNILLDERGQPRLTDFGLAKMLSNDSELTRSGEALGSPSYMPPEQALGQSERMGVTSDVYSLGAVLYEMLTGRAPFRAATAVDTMRQVVSTEPVPPRKLNPAVPVELETIALRCLEKEPSRRYQSAQEVADEIGRWMRGEPILARPLSIAGRSVKWAKRHPAVAALSAAVAALLVVGAAGAYFYAARVRTERDTAERRGEESRDHLARSLFDQALVLRSSDAPERRAKALTALEKAARLLAEPRRATAPPAESVIPRAGLRSEALAALLMSDAVPVYDLQVRSPAGGASLDPNGRFAAGAWIENPPVQIVGDPDHYSGPRGDFAFYDLAGGKKLMGLKGLAALGSHPAFSPDGRLAAVPVLEAVDVSRPEWEARAVIVLYDLTTQQAVKKLAVPNDMPAGASERFLVFSPDGARLATKSAPGNDIIVWELAKGEGAVLAKCGQTASGMPSSAFTPDSIGVVFPLNESKLAVRDLASGAQREIALPMPMFGPLALDRGGSLFSVAVVTGKPVGGAAEGVRLVLDWKTGTQKFSIPLEHRLHFGRERPAADASFSGDGRLAFCDGPDLKIMDLLTGRVTMRIPGSAVATMDALAWSPDSRFLTAVTTGGMARRWEIHDDPQVRPLPGPHQPGAAFAWSGDGAWFAFLNGATVQLRPHRGGAAHELILPVPQNAHGQRFSDLVFRHDSSRLAVLYDGAVYLFDVKTCALLPGSRKGVDVSSLAFAPNGHLLVIRSGQVITVEDATDGHDVWKSSEVPLKNTLLSGWAASDGCRLVLGRDHPVRLITYDGSNAPVELPVRGTTVPDPGVRIGSRVAVRAMRASAPHTATEDGPGDFTVSVFHAASGAELADYPGAITGLFNADETLLALGRTDGAVEFRDGASGELLLRWQAGAVPVTRMAFAPDNSALTVADTQNPVQTLDLTKLRETLAKISLDW